jgi:hypothetical protein
MNDPILDQPDITRYDRGYTLLLNGSKAAGMPMITASALAGQPHAISTLIWQNVLDDQINEAINNYGKCLTPAQAWIETESRRLAGIRGLPTESRTQIIGEYQYQISNFKSNAALAYLAAGQEATALRMWSDAAKEHGHIESRFYPIFHQKKNDPAAVMKHLSENFHPEELKSLITSLAEETKGSTGWFKNWSNESLELLRKVNQQAMAGTVAITGAWMASRAVRHYFEEQNEEAIDQAADSFFNWLGDFFG